MISTLSVTKPLSAQEEIPSPSVTKVLLFTVFPRAGLPKYRYLQCSRALGSPSIAIYNFPGLAQVGISSLSVTKPLPKYRYLQCSRALGSPSIAIYSVPALAQVGISSLSVTKPISHLSPCFGSTPV